MGAYEGASLILVNPPKFPSFRQLPAQALPDLQESFGFGGGGGGGSTPRFPALWGILGFGSVGPQGFGVSGGAGRT